MRNPSQRGLAFTNVWLYLWLKLCWKVSFERHVHKERVLGTTSWYGTNFVLLLLHLINTLLNINLTQYLPINCAQDTNFTGWTNSCQRFFIENFMNVFVAIIGEIREVSNSIKTSPNWCLQQKEKPCTCFCICAIEIDSSYWTFCKDILIKYFCKD